MIYYASRTGCLRNIDALRRAGFRILVSRNDPQVPRGMQYALDNGAWGDFQAKRGFDEEAFERFLDRYGAGCDWVVLPDIVAGGLESLQLSVRWINRVRSAAPSVLIAVQDGMTEADLEPYVGPHVGIFLGGSTEWKLETMIDWGRFCAARKLHYHVARVNTRKRMNLAIAAGATSADGSCASRYSKNAPKVERWTRASDLFAPERAP